MIPQLRLQLRTRMANLSRSDVLSVSSPLRFAPSLVEGAF